MTEENRCNICDENVEESKSCFYGCSYMSCIKCISAWIKIIDRQPTFECPQCKRKCVYIESKNITDQTSIENKEFSEFCKNNSYILDEIVEKYKNEMSQSSLNFGSFPVEISFQSDDPMTQAETQSDIANILRHLPHLLGRSPPTNTTTTQTPSVTPPTQTQQRQNTSWRRFNIHSHHPQESFNRQYHDQQQQWRRHFYEEESRYRRNPFFSTSYDIRRRNHFHDLIERGLFD